MICQNSTFNVSSLLFHRKYSIRMTRFVMMLLLVVYLVLYYPIMTAYQPKNNEVSFNNQFSMLSPANSRPLFADEDDQHQYEHGERTIASLPSTCRSLIRTDNDDRQRRVCRGLIDGTQSVNKTPMLCAPLIDKSTDYVSCVAGISNCSHFRSAFGYTDYVTKAEREFPLAFSLLTYENFEQTERLLRLIYRPHNVYCLHVDAKSSPEMHSAAEAVASCLPNVLIVRPPVEVVWGQISVVEAELRCMKLLLTSHPSWKYFINLVGRDFPLRTNSELVKILKAYKGANDVAGTLKNRHLDWFHYSWMHGRRTGRRKSVPPHGFVVTKGSTHLAVTRAFAEFALNDHRATDLLEWMSDVHIPDEHFFQTLNHNPQLNSPGSFRGCVNTFRVT